MITDGQLEHARIPRSSGQTVAEVCDTLRVSPSSVKMNTLGSLARAVEPLSRASNADLRVTAVTAEISDRCR